MNNNIDLSRLLAEKEAELAALRNKELSTQHALSGKQIIVCSFDSRDLPSAPYQGKDALGLTDSSLNIFSFSKERINWLERSRDYLKGHSRRALVCWVVTDKPHKAFADISKACLSLPTQAKFVRDSAVLRLDDMMMLRSFYHSILDLEPKARTDRVPLPWENESMNDLHRLAKRIRSKLCIRGINPDHRGAA